MFFCFDSGHVCFRKGLGDRKGQGALRGYGDLYNWLVKCWIGALSGPPDEDKKKPKRFLVRLADGSECKINRPKN